MQCASISFFFFFTFKRGVSAASVHRESAMIPHLSRNVWRVKKKKRLVNTFARSIEKSISLCSKCASTNLNLKNISWVCSLNRREFVQGINFFSLITLATLRVHLGRYKSINQKNITSNIASKTLKPWTKIPCPSSWFSEITFRTNNKNHWICVKKFNKRKIAIAEYYLVCLEVVHQSHSNRNETINIP